MRIDSHQHFWQYDPSRHAWIDDTMHKIQKDFMPQDLLPILERNDIDGTVLVQVDQTEQETQFCLEIAEKHEMVKGVVGWLDLQSSNIEQRLKAFSENSYLKGIRHIVQAESDNFMDQSKFRNGISRLAKFTLSYDILVFPPQLPSTIRLVEKFPDQKFVLDHIAKPFIKEQSIKQWADDIKELALNENVFCKVSGMVTEAHWTSWKESDLYPYMDVVFEAFGCDRIMYGSDWPVCTVAASYSQVLNLLLNYISQFSTKEQLNIMGMNAMKFYNLK